MTLDAMKLARDGQLYYGLPNAVRIKQAQCAEMDHDDEWIEYTSGAGVCMGCGAVVPPLGKTNTKLSDLRNSSGGQ